MKKLNRLGYFATFFTALYAVFKFVQIPGAAWMMLLAGILISIYFPLLFLNSLRKRMDGKLNLVYKFGGILLALFILSAVFKFNFGGFYIFPTDDTEILIFSLPPITLNIAYYLFSFIFIPWLLYVEYKKNKNGLFKNIIGGLGLSIISISLIGFQLHVHYHRILFITGNILFILIFLPWHIISIKDKNEKINNIFQILILGYILILFTYGIFLKWDVSWHEVLMNSK
jgi:hypothetical protein